MSATNVPKYSGVFCPAITPFDESGRIDFTAAGELYDHLIRGEIDGIVVLGSIGEFQGIESEAAKRLIRFAVDHVAGRCRVVAGTGGTVVADVVERTRYAEEAGADAAMIIPPYYAPVTDEGLLAHYGAIATATTIDLLLYNFPGRTGYGISPEIIRELASRHERIVGLKDTVDSISHTRAVINAVLPSRPDFAVLSGFDEYIFVNLLSGGAGTVNGLTNLFPGLFRRAFDAYANDDLATMREVQAALVGLMQLYTIAPNFVATFKYAASLIVPGVSPACAPPEVSLGDAHRDAVHELLGDLGSWQA